MTRRDRRLRFKTIPRDKTAVINESAPLSYSEALAFTKHHYGRLPKFPTKQDVVRRDIRLSEELQRVDEIYSEFGEVK